MTLFDPLPEARTLSVMPTYRCTAECAHCGTLSSPREKTRLPVDHMLSAIDQAADNGYVVVVFTGGEPTLAGRDLIAGIERAAARGLIVRMVTNAHWAISAEAADRRLREWMSAGLSEINYSTGDQHTRFVPLERVFRATRAAAKAGLRVCIMVETVKERRVTEETIEADPEFAAIRTDFPEVGIRIHESPWMPLSPSQVQEYPGDILANAGNLAMRSGCNSVLSTTTIEADGRIGACCGLGMRLIPELQLGAIADTSLADADREAGDDFLKRWIRVEGTEKILAWAATHDPEIEWENMYAHRCQACLRIYQDPKVRAVIRDHHQEKIADVMFGEWLLFRFNPGGTAQSSGDDTVSATVRTGG